MDEENISNVPSIFVRPLLRRWEPNIKMALFIWQTSIFDFVCTKQKGLDPKLQTFIGRRTAAWNEPNAKLRALLLGARTDLIPDYFRRLLKRRKRVKFTRNSLRLWHFPGLPFLIPLHHTIKIWPTKTPCWIQFLLPTWTSRLSWINLFRCKAATSKK